MWELAEGFLVSEGHLVRLLNFWEIAGVWFINRVEDGHGAVLARKVQKGD
jgi:hypothetical protein